MLVNPGGPGGSGLIYSVLGAFVPGAVGASYDWIGFDPRGVGDSVPALSCDPNYLAGPGPPDDAATLRIEFSWLLKSAKYAVDCARSGGFLLGHLKTTDNVADMDAIRQALGESRINFYGFSYGTYLGHVYATLCPSQVKRMVLDSNVDPRRVWYDANLDQDYGFETVIQKFFDWVALHDDVYGLGAANDDVEAKYYAALASLTANPQGQLGASEWVDAFPRRGLCPVPLARGRRGLRRLREQRRPRSCHRALPRPGHSRRRQRLRHVPGHGVHRRSLAAQLADSAPRQRPRRDRCALLHVGQRLVQRSVLVMARALRPTRQRRWGGSTADPASRRDARRGYGLHGQPRSTAALPECVAHRHGRGREPRQQPVRRCRVR
ncbi:MAG: alpha/beta fold hydrolase [Actinobacteria bacterium]|nr:MAG: alpha/beta fold hydrolase [Actinomycetota bacterium]